MLKVTNISKTFFKGTSNEKKALNGLSLTLNDGDFCTVIGGNGAGKSTLLNAIAGAYIPDAGTIEINGTDVTRVSEYKRAKYIGRVFQDPLKALRPACRSKRIFCSLPEEGEPPSEMGFFRRRS